MKTLVTLMLIALTAACAWGGQVVYASFDDVPASTNIFGHYPGLYVNGSAEAATWARSAPNVAQGTGSEFTFTRGVWWVELYSRGAISVAAFRDDWSLLGWQELDPYAPWQHVRLQFSEPIWRIAGADTYETTWWIDDLSYEIVPEPASLVGLALGLVGLVGWRRRRRVR